MAHVLWPGVPIRLDPSQTGRDLKCKPPPARSGCGGALEIADRAGSDEVVSRNTMTTGWRGGDHMARKRNHSAHNAAGAFHKEWCDCESNCLPGSAQDSGPLISLAVS